MKVWGFRIKKKKKKVSLRSRPHYTQEEFENATLFLRLGLPSTLIRHENGAFRKGHKLEEFESPAMRFLWIQRHAFCMDTSKLTVIVALSNFSGVVSMENI